MPREGVVFIGFCDLKFVSSQISCLMFVQTECAWAR